MNIQKIIDETRANAELIQIEIGEIEPQPGRWPEVALLLKAQLNLVRSAIELGSLLHARQEKHEEGKAA